MKKLKKKVNFIFKNKHFLSIKRNNNLLNEFALHKLQLNRYFSEFLNLAFFKAVRKD